MELEKVKETTRTFLGKYIKKSITDDQNLFKSGLLNSLFAMQLVMFIEKEFHMKVENEDLDIENFNSVDAIAGFVARKTISN